MKIFLYTLIGLISLSCSESAQELITNHKGDAQVQFKQLYKCYEIALSTPAVTRDAITWERNDANTNHPETNIYQIGIESFKDLAIPLDVPFDGTRRREHADMARLFGIDLSQYQRPHTYQVDPDYRYHELESGESCVNAINQFLNAKYLLINRISAKSKPSVIDSETYVMGYVGGDVLVFDIVEAKLIGGYRIETKSKDMMQLPATSDLEKNLNADLGMRAYRTTLEGFAALTPSVLDYSFEL